MPLLDYKKREINCKVVYYGTALGGKTTNLKHIHGQLAPTTRGEMTSLQTQTDRTLYFDFLPVEIGTVHDLKVRFSLYTVPGQVEYNSSRKLILNGADAIVFVADSSVTRAMHNKESLQNMIENLATYNITPEALPWVLQYNKRDLADAMPVERMEEELNHYGVPSFQAVASEGPGVFATLRGVSKLMLEHIASMVK
jgi:signal recognition particle receptor subunit beta